MTIPQDLIDTAIDLMVREKFSPWKNPPHSAFIDPGEMEIKALVSRLRCSEEEESKKATWSISNLSRRPVNRRAIVEQEALPILVEFLGDKSDTRISDVLSLLTNLSQTARYRKEVLKTDALGAVIGLVKSGKIGWMEQSMEFLANMCLSRQAKEALLKEKGVLEVLVTFVKKANDNGKSHVIRALVQLSADPSVANNLLRIGTMKCFMDPLMTEDWNVKSWVAELVYNLSLDEKNLNRFGTVCVWYMLELLDARSERFCKVWALKALGNFTRRAQLRRYVVRQGGIRLITGLLKNDDMLCAEVAARCLANLTKDSEKVKPCMRKGVMRALVRLLEANSPDALATVANVSEVEEQRPMLLDSGVIPLLVQFLKHNNLTGSYHLDTLRCLAHISDAEESMSWFLEQSVISRVVQSLRSRCLMSCSYAADIIRNICQTPQGIRKVVESDAIWPLARLMQCKSDETMRSAVHALSVLSTNRNARVQIAQFDGITDLLELVRTGTNETKIFAAKTLYNMSSNMDVQRVIVSEGGIPTLISMLASQSYEVRENALVLLIRLGNHEPHWVAIKEGGGVGPMFKQLVVGQFRDTVDVCQSFVRFFNQVILTILRVHFRID